MVGSLDDLDRPFPNLAQRLSQLVSGIATIGEDVPQRGMAADDLRQDDRRAIAVLHVGGMDHGMNQIALSGFEALAVDHPSAGRSFAPDSFPPDQQQGVIERKPKTIVTPQVEPAPHRGNRWNAGRQHPPGQPSAQQIQDRLDDPPQQPFARTAHMRRRRQKLLKQRPFGVGQITWQSKVRAGILRLSGLGPDRRSPVVLAKPLEAKLCTAQSTTWAGVKLTHWHH